MNDDYDDDGGEGDGHDRRAKCLLSTAGSRSTHHPGFSTAVKAFFFSSNTLLRERSGMSAPCMSGSLVAVPIAPCFSTTKS